VGGGNGEALSWLSALPARWRGLAPLVVLGVASELVYLVYFVGQFPLLRYYRRDTDLGTITGHGHGAFVLFVAMICLLFVFFGGAIWQTRWVDDRALKVVLGFGAAFAVTAIFVYPLTATDLFSYLGQSWVWVHYQQNPIFTPPARFPHDPLMPLSDGYERFGTPYGPLGIVIDAIPAVVVGNRLLASLLLLKGLFSAMALGCAYLSYRILREVRAPLAVSGALVVAWNPLVIVEVSVNGHNDIAMMVLVLLGLLLAVRQRLVLGPVVLSAACMVKYGAAFLIPLVLAYAVRRQKTWDDRVFYVGSVAAWAFAVVVVSYLPFWEGTGTVSSLLSQSERSVNSLSSVLASMRTGTLAVDRTAVVGWVLFAALYAYLLWDGTVDSRRLLLACFVGMFGFLALAASNVEVWYLIWPAVLAAATPALAARACAVIFSLGAELSVVVFGYVFVWLNLDLGTIPRLNAVTYVMTFLPAAVVLGLAWMSAGQTTGGHWWRDMGTVGSTSGETVPSE
jgi:hypothetical protein